MISIKHPRMNHAKVICETIDGEVILVNMGNGCYYSLDGAAAAIWACIEDEASVEVIATTLENQYTGDTKSISDAIQNFIAELYEEGLIIQNNNAAVDSPGEKQGDDILASDGEKPPFEVPVLHKYTDMQDLLWLDPIHEVDEAGWPNINEAAPENHA